ncbi:DNA polymerase III subunit alpha [Nannocystis pusilla]|uniref:DNA polymerase III subunit alpha n=1 Tax=Nannocystis pusilla TaxID=889268 RepID=UPI003BF25BD8
MAADGSIQGGSADFAHLHLHSQYSLLDGAIRTKDLCKIVKQRGMSAVAVTDHGNMFGALQFYQEAKAVGVKPIFGCEAYVSDGDMNAKTDRKNYHLVLLARDLTGYKNLQFLVSKGHLEGFYYNPRIDRKILREHSEGLIGLSACLGGHISRLINGGDMDAARQTVLEYKSIFEPGSYYLELQPNGMADQERVNAALAQLSIDCGVPLVATNDCHYVNQDEAHAHEVLMCMGQGRTLDDPKRMKHECDAFFIKTPDQMLSYFGSNYPSAFENAGEIARRCNVELKLGKPELPDFKLPEGTEEDLPGYLRKVAHSGLEERFGELQRRGQAFDPDMYRQRLDYELGVITQMKFPGYFLIVWDFIRHAKKIGVPVGPGRGSGAGSLVAYALRITDLDPIQYSLLFERFLNPERISMPDFDIDFCMDRREEVIRYVTERYGSARVGQIATFHSLKARGLVRDVCRVMGLQPSEANEIAKHVPEGPKVTLSMAMADPEPMKEKAKESAEAAAKLSDAIMIAEAASKLRLRAREDGRVAEVLKIGQALEGLNRHAGMHAAGIVIGNRDLWEHVPCFQADGKIVTQFTMTDVELAGLVKFDFLGLKTLTVLDTAVRLINNFRPADDPFDLGAIPMDDAGVYEMISRGDTTGVFQLESSGFKDLLKKLRPDCFGDIVAAVALYRPGPLEGGMVDQFIDCKHGRRAIEYPHELLTEVLKETYGVFVYQEQVMQAAQVLAGFSLGAADMMRRAMGKKKKSEMDKQRALFVEGCAKASNIPNAKAEEIFDLIDKFAGYGFNKSHSAAYGLITYQTGYLKHHFPASFMAALMTCDKSNNDNVVKFIAEARAMGLVVLSPDINESGRDFSVVRRKREGDGFDEQIRFGLAGIRGVGENAVDAILAARTTDGPFTSLFELCRRVDLKKVNKRTQEGLVCAGALDAIADKRGRACLHAAIERAIEQGQGASRDRAAGQFGLFDAIADSAPVYTEEYPEVEPWEPREELLKEREALGFYLTGHPLDRYQQDVDKHATCRTGQIEAKHNGQEVTIAGVICDLREVQTRSGKGAMGFFQLEDQFGRVESVVFPKTYARADEATGLSLGERLAQIGSEPVFVTGKCEVETSEDGEANKFKILVESVQEIRTLREQSTRKVLLKVPLELLTPERILRLKQIVSDNAGTCSMELEVVSERYAGQVVFGDKFGVRADDKLIAALERLFGAKVARLA